MEESSVSYNYLDSYLNELRSEGRYAFTWDEIKEHFKLTKGAINQSLHRLKDKKRVVPIRRGFYAIISPEYSKQGMLPPALFIDDMMRSLDRKYYVGLISAAALHGAAHQQPMEYFVITEKPALRDIKTNKVKINFFVKKEWQLEAIEKRKTDAGSMNISSPELTALDLLFYIDKVGISRAVTILEELSEEIKPSKMAKTAKFFPQVAAIQRLGYLLEVELQNNLLSEAVWKALNNKRFFTIPLVPGQDKEGEVNTKWKIIPNVIIESDF